MKATTLSAILAPAAVANAQWWGGAPDCAQSCFSSLWSTASSWPAPTSYCSATQAASVSSCISSACSATPTAVTSYSSLSASLCSQWSSCSNAGSTGVITVSLPAFTGSWGPGGPGGHFGPGGPGGPPGGGPGPWGNSWSDATKTWTGGVYTVTGCEWNGSPWAGGPGGWGGGLGGSPWGNWGHGWTWSTATQTVTEIITITTGGVTSYSTSIGLATVAQAVSGDVTQTSIISGSTASPTGNAAAGGKSDLAGVKVMGAMLGGVVAVAGLL